MACHSMSTQFLWKVRPLIRPSWVSLGSKCIQKSWFSPGLALNRVWLVDPEASMIAAVSPELVLRIVSSELRNASFGNLY